MRLAMRRFAAALGAVLVLGGCERSPTESRNEGEVQFTFSGDSLGSFQARGTLTRTNELSGTYAVGAVQTGLQGPFLSVIGQTQARVPGRIDVLLLNVQPAQVGTVACTDPEADCDFGVLFATGVHPTTEEFDEMFLSTTGTVTVSAIGTRRAQGTFSIAMEELALAGDEPRLIQISGSFDVPLVTDIAR